MCLCTRFFSNSAYFLHICILLVLHGFFINSICSFFFFFKKIRYFSDSKLGYLFCGIDRKWFLRIFCVSQLFKRIITINEQQIFVAFCTSVSTFFSYSICMQFAKLDYRHFLRKGKKKKKRIKKRPQNLYHFPQLFAKPDCALYSYYFHGELAQEFPLFSHYVARNGDNPWSPE